MSSLTKLRLPVVVGFLIIAKCAGMVGDGNWKLSGTIIFHGLTGGTISPGMGMCAFDVGTGTIRTIYPEGRTYVECLGVHTLADYIPLIFLQKQNIALSRFDLFTGLPRTPWLGKIDLNTGTVKLLYSDPEDRVRLGQAVSLDERHLVESFGNIDFKGQVMPSVDVTSDGGSSNQLAVLDLDSGKSTWLTIPPGYCVTYELSWSYDNRYVAFDYRQITTNRYGEEGAAIYETSSRKLLTLKKNASNLQWSANGVYTSYLLRSERKLIIEQGGKRHRSIEMPDNVLTYCWSPDSHYIAYQFQNGPWGLLSEIRVVDVSSGEQLAIMGRSTKNQSFCTDSVRGVYLQWY
jgi:hypothetical protein